MKVKKWSMLNHEQDLLDAAGCTRSWRNPFDAKAPELFVSLQNCQKFLQKKLLSEMIVEDFVSFLTENTVQKFYLAHQAVHGPGRVLLVPKVPNISVKWTIFKLFRLEKEYWSTYLIHCSGGIVFVLLRLCLRKHCTDRPPRLRNRGV